MIKKIGLFALLACISLKTIAYTDSEWDFQSQGKTATQELDRMRKGTQVERAVTEKFVQNSEKKVATNVAKKIVENNLLKSAKDDPISFLLLGAVVGAGYTGYKIIDKDLEVPANQYEQDLLRHPENYQNILSQLKSVEYGELIRKKAGIGGEFVAKQRDLEATPSFQNTYQLVKTLFSKMENSNDWKTDYAEYRIKMFKIYLDKNNQKYSKLDETSSSFLDNIRQISPELTDAEKNAMDIMKIKKLDCSDSTYKKQIYNDLITQSPAKFKQSFAGVLVTNHKIKQSLIGEVSEFDTNSHYELERGAKPNDNLEHDHVPSFAALKYFMQNIQKIPDVSNKNEYKYLYSNASAIEVKLELHKNGRTHSYKNDKDQIKEDSQNLYGTVFFDVATYMDRMQNSLIKLSYSQTEKMVFLKSMMILHERNKLLCLYD